MAKRNGSYPESVQPGVPQLSKTPAGWSRVPLGKFLTEIKRPVDMDDDHQYMLVTVKRSRGGAEERGVMLGRDKKWVHFFGPVSGKTKVDSFVGYAAFLGQARGGTPSGLNC
jgi:hypothetical protein